MPSKLRAPQQSGEMGLIIQKIFFPKSKLGMRLFLVLL